MASTGTPADEAPAAPSALAPLTAPPVIDASEAVGGEAIFEADNPQDIENDSAYGEGTTASSTTSVTSSILNYTYENGRRYHAFREGEYILPNDETEQDRLDLLHHIWKLLLGGKLYEAPMNKEDIHRALDVGTGTGIWAIDFADEFPNAVVTGTDLSPIQPPWVPPNCKFLVDDCEGPWAFAEDQKFDYIHVRGMGGTIRDWPAFYAEIYKNLKPGGYVELQEYETWFSSVEDPTLAKAPTCREWQDYLNRAANSFGKKLDNARDHKQPLIDAGFLNVVDNPHVCPIGPWPKNKKAKEIGRFQLIHTLDAIEPYTFALFSRVLGWNRERMEVFTAQVRSEIKDPKNHLFCYFHCIHGRKPEDAQ